MLSETLARAGVGSFAPPWTPRASNANPARGKLGAHRVRAERGAAERLFWRRIHATPVARN
eukprot:6038252-Pyramimonas_sp.AAC.1